MNHKIFHERVLDLLRSLEEPNVVVMDNTIYHSKSVEEIPNSKTLKADIVMWLSESGIEHNSVHTVAELLTI